MAAQYQIKIGYFESPSKFYFTPFARDLEAQGQLTKLEMELSQYCAMHSSEASESSLRKGEVSANNGLSFKIWCQISARMFELLRSKQKARVFLTFDSFQIIAFFYTNWSKWIRGEIVSVRGEGSAAYKIHLIDYSHSKSFSDITMMELPDKFKVPSPTVRVGSLGLQPCNTSRDRSSLEKVATPVNWSQAVFEFLKGFGEYNDSRRYLFETHRIDETTHVGDVFAVSKCLSEMNIGEVLIKRGLAQRDSLGSKASKPLTPLFEVPSTNFQEIFDALMPADEVQKNQKTQKKSPIILPAGYDFGKYMNRLHKMSSAQPIAKETVQEKQIPVETILKAAEMEAAEIVRVGPTSEVINHLGMTNICRQLTAQPKECIDVVKVNHFVRFHEFVT